jgi:dihydrofolate reductase
MQVFLIAALSADGFIAPLTTAAHNTADTAAVNTTSASVAAAAGRASATQPSIQPSTAWTSQQDQRFFHQRTKQAGVVVMGRRTFTTIGRPLSDRLNIIYTHFDRQDFLERYPRLQELEVKPVRPEAKGGWQLTSAQPQDLINKLQQQGFEQVAICGGNSIYSQFMQANLIDTLYLTIEPILFGQGVSLFKKSLKFDLKSKPHPQLKLISQQQLNEQGALLLEYEVEAA